MPIGAMGTMKMSPYTIMSGTPSTRASFCPPGCLSALASDEARFAPP